MSTLLATRPTRQQSRDAPAPERSRHLGCYYDSESEHKRHIISRTLADESVLVLDTGSGGVLGARLVAHLAPDEPPENAEIICELYLADPTRGRCRALTSDDLEDRRDLEPGNYDAILEGAPVVDEHARVYRILWLDGIRPVPELRWTRTAPSGAAGPCELLSLREVVAAIEDYEPARSMTLAALQASSAERELGTGQLRDELRRLTSARLVLNRGLREAVQRTVARGEASMAEIALRCGHLKSGGEPRSGDSSWLERRIGLRAEAGETTSHRWVRTDVLARIARDGLGLAPNEVEV